MKNLFNKFLNWIERTGNKLPDPLSLFFYLCLIVLAMSALLSTMGVQVTHPADGKIIAVQNLLSVENLRRIFTEMVKNFSSFPPLGMVLVTVIGIGVAEHVGFINTCLKKLATAVPKSLLTSTLVFLGIMSNMAADAGYVVLTPLGAMLFAAFGRHPIAGLAAAFAGVSGGFSANLLVTSLDPLLGGISTKAAQLLVPSYEVLATANYYFMVASTFILTAIGTFVTDKIVEPRLGKWEPPKGFTIDTSLGDLSDDEKKGLRNALGALVLWAFAILALVLPENGVLRHGAEGLKPFYESLVPLLMLVFLTLGLVYGFSSKKLKSDKDVSKIMGESMGTMGGYIVLAFVAAQFIAYFNWSNLGLVVAITGAQGLKAVGFSGFPLVVAFVIVTAFVNLFIGSASAKWAIMGPVFVPMMMLMGLTPEATQNAYRVGDSVTNIISPLLPYMPLIIVFARKYVPTLGLGTLISVMMPFSMMFLVFWTVMLGIWMALGLPLGPGVEIHMTPPGQGQ